MVVEAHHAWNDAEWMAARGRTDMLGDPVSVYEVHLASWQRGEDNTLLDYREAGKRLVAHCRDLGFTHVELLPVAEHPFSGSWGYQVTGYYAPTSRFGTPDDFRWMVDHLHQNGIGVLLDWVPAHFPRDDWALAKFDGTALYEHADPRSGEHPDWGTLVFNYGRNEVRNFLTANARYWCEEFHIDGLRFDAVASMLYLDYSRESGAWIPNRFGGRENLEAMSLLREINEQLTEGYPGAIAIAEESTAWPGVSRPVSFGGLGFRFKWNMGWMHDTLDYMNKDPIYRRYHHHQLTFGMWYAYSENFVLPLSHDEVVHGKGSLLSKMPGDEWQRFANLRALLGWMWAHPGKKLLFQGGEIGQGDEWNAEREIQWWLLQYPFHAGVQQFVRDLNARYRETPALYERDYSQNGFQWIDAGNVDQSVLSFMRLDANDHPGLVCIGNFSPVVYENHRVGLPSPGRWNEALNGDAAAYEGSGVGNGGAVFAEEAAWNGQPYSAVITVPPLAVLWLSPQQ
jgi:1,4-alpha-glucan branching enzyme